jgi:hypothetical protein
MKRGSTLFLKFVIFLIGIAALAWLFWFPSTEGRAKDLDLVSIYLNPVIAYMYLASTSFFVGLYQAFKLLGYIEQNKVFSQESVTALRNIKYCVLAFIGFIIVAEALLILFGMDDDKAGPVALGIYTIFVSVVVATAVAIAQRLLQNAVDIKSENDLTV